MPTTSVVRTAEEKRLIRAARRKLAVANNSLRDAIEVAFVGICLRNIYRYVVSFEGLRVQTSTGELNDPNVNLESFEKWLASRKEWTRWTGFDSMEFGIIADECTMLIYDRKVFLAPQMITEASSMLAPIWLKRLPRIVETLNDHPLTNGLPEIKLMVDSSKPFRFDIFFSVEPTP